MFSNIGKKIKGLAKLVCWIGIIAFAIIGGMQIVDGVKNSVTQDIINGSIIVVAGFFGSWISSFFAYGFGELIDKTAEIAENTRK